MTHIPTTIPTEPIRRSFIESCKIFIAFSTITDNYTDSLWLSVFYRELQKHYCPCHNHRCCFRRNHWRRLHIPMRATVRVPGQSAHLPNESPTEAANPMRACSDTYLPTDMPTDFENSGRIFKILVRNSKNTDENKCHRPRKYYSKICQ